MSLMSISQLSVSHSDPHWKIGYSLHNLALSQTHVGKVSFAGLFLKDSRIWGSEQGSTGIPVMLGSWPGFDSFVLVLVPAGTAGILARIFFENSRF